MHPFVETISVVGAVAISIVGAVMVLTLFYRVLAWISDSGAKPETIAVRGILKKDTLATVHVGRETFERVRFLGFTNADSIKTHLPFELNGMVILEDEPGTRYLVRARDIRKIVIAADSARQRPTATD